MKFGQKQFLADVKQARIDAGANQRTIVNAVRITLDGETPISLNKYYAGAHWSKRKRDAQAQQLLVRSQIDPNIKPFDVPVKIKFTIYYKDKRIRDIDNATVKMYIDGLKPFVIHDDDWRYVEAVEKVYRYDKENPRVEIDIYPTGLPSLMLNYDHVNERYTSMGGEIHE